MKKTVINNTKQEEQFLTQKNIIKTTSIGITGLSVLKLAPTQVSVLESAIIKSATTFLNAKSVSFIGILGIPNYFLIALVIAGVGVSYFTIKDIFENKGKKVR